MNGSNGIYPLVMKNIDIFQPWPMIMDNSDHVIYLMWVKHGKTIFRTIPQSSPQTGGINLPFPVMGGKHGIVFPDFDPQKCPGGGWMSISTTWLIIRSIEDHKIIYCSSKKFLKSFNHPLKTNGTLLHFNDRHPRPLSSRTCHSPWDT